MRKKTQKLFVLEAPTKTERKQKNNSNPICMDEWTNYFSKLHNDTMSNDYDIQFTSKIEESLTRINELPHQSDVLVKNFTIDEIKHGISQLKNGKAQGMDSISNEMLKAGSKQLSPVICHLYNQILKTEQFPNLWSSGYIVPLHK